MNLEDLTKATFRLEIEKVNILVEDFLQKGEEPMKILDALNKGIEKVGELFERGEYFLSELIMAGEIMNDALKLLTPHLQKEKGQHKGRIVLGTIEGDLHDIGKNIMKVLLISSGFEVVDLGVDVPPKKFAEKALTSNADVIGISALLSTTVPTTAKVVEELKRQGAREKIKVIIGGAAVRDYHTKEYGVDAAVNNAVIGVNIIKNWCST